MTAAQMINLLRSVRRTDPLVNFRLLADNVCGAKLKDGRRLATILDFAAWLRELGEAADRTEGQFPAERSTGLKVTPPRLELRLEQERVCPGCGHAHEGDYECGTDMGGAGKCGCRMEVRV
jgi:hypothetical protein